MIPQNLKDILSSGNNVGLYQTLAMILFIVVFIGVVASVFGKPKKYYEEDANAPLNDDNEN